jgi:hypothetical protein
MQKLLDPLFELNLIEQNWLGEEPDQFDLCSHGRLVLKMAGVRILDEREEYGLSESALALLRTLERDHTPSATLAEKLIFHGCGMELMIGCPIGVDWNVRHKDQSVLIDNVRRWDFPDENRPTCFEGLTIAIPAETYRKPIVAFARQVKAFFAGQNKEFFDEKDRLAYENFWCEFDNLLARQG